MRLWPKRGICPGCGGHVFPHKAKLKNVKFDQAARVTFNGDAHLDACIVEFNGNGDVAAYKDLTIDRSTLHAHQGLSVRGGQGGQTIVQNGFLVANTATMPTFSPLIPQAEKKEPKELELTFGTEVLTAWRAWNFVHYQFRGGSTEKRLTAIASRRIWPPFERMEAECHAKSHEAPWADCMCGIWAVPESDEIPLGNDVYGEVYLWGRVLEFQKGYRAQYAYPKRLVVANEKVAEDLGRIYGVPVQLDSDV